MNKKQFFASSNSMMGFHSYFNDIYDPIKLKKIYIIKGGPGTGKSSTMKALGDMFEKKYECEYFLCSSDPRSLDGIIIGNTVAVLDGTSPHITEAKYPKAVEVLIDNAVAISDDVTECRNKIIELTNEKSKFYRYAYTYLKAAGELKSEQIKKIRTKVDETKLDSAIDRYFKQSLKKGKCYTSTIRLTEGITPSGVHKTKAFEAMSDQRAIIVNGRGYEEIVFDALIKKAKEYDLDTVLSYDPLIPHSINGLYFKDSSVCAVSYCKEIHGEVDYDEYKVINFERFINRADLNELKPNLKFAEKCIESLIEEAVANLSLASKVHKELENIYIKYTDYSKIDDNTHIIANGISDIFANTSIVHNKP